MINDGVNLKDLTDGDKMHDEHGNPILDENGNPITEEKSELSEQAQYILKQVKEISKGEIYSELGEAHKKGIDVAANLNEHAAKILQQKLDEKKLTGEEQNSSSDESIEEIEENIDNEEEISDKKKSNIGTDKIQIIKTELKNKLKPISNKIDLSSFTIDNDPITVYDALKTVDVDVSDWVMFDTGVPFTMKAFTGMEIEDLNPANSRRNEYNTIRDIYTLIYNHITNEDKPEFEEWLKLTKFSDIPDLYFNIFRSTFMKSNFITYPCTCDDGVFIEEVDIDDMYKLVDDEAKDKFSKIFEQDSINVVKKYQSMLIQINDDYVVSIKEPSIFNIIFENISLNVEFREKHQKVLSILSFIDNLYKIDRDTKKLKPIEYDKYEKDLRKTVKSKVITYSKVLDKLNSDQFYNITAALSKISPDRKLKYIIPERTCPKCGNVVKEYEEAPEKMLFTRHQLTAFLTS